MQSPIPYSHSDFENPAVLCVVPADSTSLLARSIHLCHVTEIHLVPAHTFR